MEDDQKFIINLAKYKDVKMRQLFITTDYLENNCKLIIDDDFLNQEFQNLDKQKPSMAKHEGENFYEYIEDNLPNLDIGQDISQYQSYEEAEEKIQGWLNECQEPKFLYQEILIKPEQFQDIFYHDDILNSDNLNEQQRLQANIQMIQKLEQLWGKYPKLAHFAQKNVMPITFNFIFSSPSKNCKGVSIKNIHQFFANIFTNFIFLLQNFQQEKLKFENISISSNIGEIYSMLSKKGPEEAVFRSLKILMRSIPPTINSVQFYSDKSSLEKVHDPDSPYLQFLRDLHSMNVMKSWNTNIILGGFLQKGLDELWQGIDSGFMSAQVVLFKAIRRMKFALINQVDPDDRDRQVPSNYVVGTI